jgi:hypothetical protein
MDGQFGRQALAQQPCAALFGLGVRARYAFGDVQFRKCPANQLGRLGLAGGREVGQPARALRDTEIGAGDRVECDVCVDVGVGDLARQCAARCV